MEQCADRVGGKLRAVERRGRKAAQHIRKRFCGDGAGFGERAATEFFGQDRSGSNRCGAAPAEKARFRNTPIHNARRYLEDVAADGIAYFDGNACARELPGVARVAEVVENGFAEHLGSIPKAAAELQRRCVQEDSTWDGLCKSTGALLSAILFGQP